MIFEFIDLGDSVRVKADNKDNTFPKNSMRILSSPLNDRVDICTLEGLRLYEIHFDTDTFIPSQATKEDLLNYLTLFFDSLGGGTGDMQKSIYDTDDNGIVDSAESVAGITNANQYYGTNGANVKGFYDLVAGGDMYKSTYDTNNNGIVDSSESVSGTTNPDDYYGTNLSNVKGFYSLSQFVSGYLLNNPIEIGDALVISSNIYPPAITATVNNYNPTGFATASVMYISSTGNQIITGLEAGVDGRVVFVSNIGTNQIKLANNSPSSLAPNRFYLDIDVIMKPSNGVILLYSEVLQRWTVLNIS